MNQTPVIEETVCPLCQAAERRPAYDFAPYAVVQCRACGLYYLSPRKPAAAMVQAYADDAYYEGEGSGYTTYTQQATALRATFRRFCQHLQTYQLAGGNLLEIGCGYGYLLEQAQGLFAQRVGTDFSPHAVEQARTRADRVYLGGVDDLPPGECYDCIVSTNVIEHVYQPQQFLKQLMARLNPQGSIVIATPNMNSVLRPLLRHRWPSFKVPEHVTYFTYTTLTMLMAQTGLVRINPLPYPHAFPLSLIAEKFGVRLPEQVGKLNVWVPTTMIALYGFLPYEPER